MTPNRSIRRALQALAVFASLSCGLACAEDKYPSSPIRLVVPFNTGGSTDLIARLIAQHAGAHLGQPIVIENRGGAGGSLGMAHVKRATPDGYTLGMASVSTHGANAAVYKSLPYDPIKDFVPVTNVAAVPSVFSVHPGVPVRTLKEFMQLARANPGKYTFASPGIGTLGHVNIMNMMMEGKFQLTHVPYIGAGRSVADTVIGKVDAVSDNLPSSLPLIKQGKLRPLAVLGAVRAPELPHVPTFIEEGINMKEAGWFGIVAPTGTPPVIVNRLNQAVHRAMASPEFQRKLKEMGGTPMQNTPDQFNAQIRAAVARYQEMARTVDITVDSVFATVAPRP